MSSGGSAPAVCSSNNGLFEIAWTGDGSGARSIVEVIGQVADKA